MESSHALTREGPPKKKCSHKTMRSMFTWHKTTIWDPDDTSHCDPEEAVRASSDCPPQVREQTRDVALTHCDTDHVTSISKPGSHSQVKSEHTSATLDVDSFAKADDHQFGDGTGSHQVSAKTGKRRKGFINHTQLASHWKKQPEERLKGLRSWQCEISRVA